MCRQAWFPPTAARDPKTLAAYFRRLERSCGGHGTGVGYVVPETPDLRSGLSMWRGLHIDLEAAANWVASRPASAWGIYHTRLVSAGTRGEEGCHPHYFKARHHRDHAVCLLTHNGTWGGWDAAQLVCKVDFPSDSAMMSWLIADRGWQIAAKLDQTIIAAFRDHDDKKWTLRAWKGSFPLVKLANGGIASEGSFGEFEAVFNLMSGDHDLAAPRVYKIPQVETVSRRHARRGPKLAKLANLVGMYEEGTMTDDEFLAWLDHLGYPNNQITGREPDRAAPAVCQTQSRSEAGTEHPDHAVNADEERRWEEWWMRSERERMLRQVATYREEDPEGSEEIEVVVDSDADEDTQPGIDTRVLDARLDSRGQMYLTDRPDRMLSQGRNIAPVKVATATVCGRGAKRNDTPEGSN